MSAARDSLCECGHPFAPTHQTPGAECAVYGCDCSTFRAAATPASSLFRHTATWPVRATMDALSRLIFRLSPGTAGAFDAWCDNHGRWGALR